MTLESDVIYGHSPFFRKHQKITSHAKIPYNVFFQSICRRHFYANCERLSLNRFCKQVISEECSAELSSGLQTPWRDLRDWHSLIYHEIYVLFIIIVHSVSVAGNIRNPALPVIPDNQLFLLYLDKNVR